ncbi:hypothetical protein LPAF129_11220 [Ligilactobacillus pabuli]|uniref:Uncharacterized protein n=1 Tax=Ligilactobacillus pabuli TaxID=2886039 RepID=A0ABQ5JHW1_9LACO|nr:hypothetical protein [Ligilactobacillus pabuli]GKS81436.1 hypothetical protein LPAF129_11220 [Ligilactobacillus pabuli]
MKRKFGLALCAVVVIVVAFFFVYSDSYVALELNHQINTMIEKKEYSKLKQLAADKQTADFLVNLNQKTRCKQTSDAQGGTSQSLHYATGLKGKTVGVEMKQESFLEWKVVQISR